MTQERPEEATEQDMPKIIADHPIGTEENQPRRRRRKIVKASPSLPRPEEFVDDEDGEEEMEAAVKRPRSTTPQVATRVAETAIHAVTKGSIRHFLQVSQKRTGQNSTDGYCEARVAGGCKTLRYCPWKVS